MRYELALAAALLAGGLAAACRAENDAPPAIGDSWVGTAPVPVTGDGLPCNVRSLLETYCTDCHTGESPSGGVALTSYANLIAPSPVDPTQTVAQRASARMADASRPMPPPGLIDDQAKATFDAWVAAGAPATVCGGKEEPPVDPPPSTDAGTTPIVDGGTADSGTSGTTTPTPPPATSVCTSGSFTSKYERDKPGTRCIQCHAAQGGPLYAVAGTLYPTLHEPTGCIANTGGAVVEITDANGAVRSITVGPDGSFAARARLEAPITVRVLANGKERRMVQAVFNGDCNGCHTEVGLQGAPGRVALP